MRQDVLALTRRAFEQDQVPQLLKGEAPYAIAPDRFLPAAPPTDWSALLREGVLPYCAQDETGERWKTLRAAICALIRATPWRCGAPTMSTSPSATPPRAGR